MSFPRMNGLRGAVAQIAWNAIRIDPIIELAAQSRPREREQPRDRRCEPGGLVEHVADAVLETGRAEQLAHDPVDDALGRAVRQHEVEHRDRQRDERDEREEHSERDRGRLLAESVQAVAPGRRDDDASDLGERVRWSHAVMIA